MTLKGDPICYPPRGMSRAEAARYVGVSTTLFDEMVADGRMPKPIRVNSRVIWDRLRLDYHFNDLSSKPVNMIDAILARSKSRKT